MNVHPSIELAARRIHDLRKAQGLSVQALSDKCTDDCPTLTRSTIAKIECGTRKTISAPELQALATALGVEPNQLLTEDQVTPPTPRANVVLSPDGALALDKLVRRTKAKKVDLLNRAVMLLEYIDAAQRAGNEVTIQQPDGTCYRIRFL